MNALGFHFHYEVHQSISDQWYSSCCSMTTLTWIDAEAAFFAAYAFFSRTAVTAASEALGYIIQPSAGTKLSDRTHPRACSAMGDASSASAVTVKTPIAWKLPLSRTLCRAPWHPGTQCSCRGCIMDGRWFRQATAIDIQICSSWYPLVSCSTVTSHCATV